jgi:plastocyanin
MTRRTAVAALATVAAFGIAAAPAAAAKKNEIRIVGGTKFKAGKYVKDDVRFKPASVAVKSGATVKVVNKGLDPAPHTISFVEKKSLPKGFEFEGSPVFSTLLTAHAANPETEEVGFFQVNDGVGVPNETAGVLEVDKLGNATNAGDSQFIAPEQGTSFKVTAKKGSVLPYYCAIHFWMQGKIKVK